MISPIYIALVILAGLLLWFVIGSRGKWWLKLPLIIFVPVFMFVVWASLSSFTGWPTKNTPDKKSLYVYGYTIEPDPIDHVKGAIYVWLIADKKSSNPLAYQPTAGEPRAFKLPYSKQLEGEVQAANVAVAHGLTVQFAQQGKGQPGGKKGRASKGRAHQHYKGSFHAYILPQAAPPRKGSQ